MLHVCEKVYALSGTKIIYGDVSGTCRITGKKSKGLFFNKWVRPTFNDWDALHPGDIISNEALFCFDERSAIVQKKAGKDKLQRFRTYSHIIHEDKWHCMTKANKKEITELIISGAEIVCLTETGQKHIFFKHKQGFWQLDELFVKPNIKLFKFLHNNMCKLLKLKFSQTEIITGKYLSSRIIKAGVNTWKELEYLIKPYRGSGFFDFVTFLLYKN